MKSGVLVHGYHTGAPNWEEIVWGNPPNALGRVPSALQIVFREEARLLVFGTGASEKDGMKEAEYTIHYLMQNLARLSEFSVFSYMGSYFIEKFLREEIASICVPEIVSQNTAEEVVCAGRIFVARGISKVYQVSSPFHIFRCHRDAMAAFRTNAELQVLLPGLTAIASDTGPEPGETIILEPPHRPDRPSSPLYSFVKRIMGLPKKEQEEIIEKALTR